MKHKELKSVTKTFMTISNWKKIVLKYFSVVRVKNIVLSASEGLDAALYKMTYKSFWY